MNADKQGKRRRRQQPPEECQTMATQDEPRETQKNPNKLTLWGEPGRSDEAMLARHAISPEFSNVTTIKAYSKSQWGADNLHVTELAAALHGQAQAAQQGDLSQGDGLLMVQAQTLNAIFNNLAQRAATAEYMPQLEQFMRLALRAQNQCRATLETLAVMKNPPIVYARQANVTTGPQQINNGTAAPPQAREIGCGQSKLSEGNNELLPDTRTSALEGRIDTQMEALGEVERAEVARR